MPCHISPCEANHRCHDQTFELTSGVYITESLPEFMYSYGYPDTQGREGRLNFGGVYRVGRSAHERTGLRLVVEGFNVETGRYEPNGAVRLLDDPDKEALAWSFAKLMNHWKIKHAHAAFIPSQMRKSPDQEYRYGRNILLGEGAEFGRFLDAVHAGKLYYMAARMASSSVRWQRDSSCSSNTTSSAM